MLNRLTLLCVICLTAGCAVSIKPPPPIPTEYLAACTPPGLLGNGTHTTVEKWAVRTAIDLRTCAEIHQHLVDSVKRRAAIYD